MAKAQALAALLFAFAGCGTGDSTVQSDAAGQSSGVDAAVESADASPPIEDAAGSARDGGGADAFVSDAVPDGGSSLRPCATNADCSPPEVCYFGGTSSFGCPTSQRGQCLGADPSCTSSVRCDCLVGAGICPANAGGMCMGSDMPTSCWYCRLPQ